MRRVRLAKNERLVANGIRAWHPDVVPNNALPALQGQPTEAAEEQASEHGSEPERGMPAAEEGAAQAGAAVQAGDAGGSGDSHGSRQQPGAETRPDGAGALARSHSV